MNELLLKLDELYSSTEPTVSDDYDNRTYFDTNIYGSLANQVSGLCNEKLITGCGYPDYQNIDILKDHEYRVYPGEKDGFGWLTGCVQKKGDKRILVFG